MGERGYKARVSLGETVEVMDSRRFHDWAFCGGEDRGNFFLVRMVLDLGIALRQAGN